MLYICLINIIYRLLLVKITPLPPFNVFLAHETVYKTTLPHVAYVTLIADLMDILPKPFRPKLIKLL